MIPYNPCRWHILFKQEANSPYMLYPESESKCGWYYGITPFGKLHVGNHYISMGDDYASRR